MNRPTMLLCWRTSPSRSVLVLTTTTSGKPSPEAAADTIAGEWAKLG